MKNSNQPEISVIVPVYHAEKYLKRCLDSLLAQTFRDIEVILVNDGGSEEDSRICEEYASADNRIVYTVQQNQGVSAARNTGLALCQGKWIMFADSDDYTDPRFCERAFQAVTGMHADMVIFDLQYMNADGTPGDIHRSSPAEGVYDSDTILKERICGNINVYVWNRIYRRDLWKGILFPVGENWEDDALSHVLIDRAEKIGIIHDVLYYKPYREDNITSLASRTFKDTEWLYRQRRRRYMYLKEKHPEMLELDRNNAASAAMRFCAFSAVTGKEPELYEEARQWLKTERLYPRGKNLLVNAAYFLLMHDLPLFRIFALRKYKAMCRERGIR